LAALPGVIQSGVRNSSLASWYNSAAGFVKCAGIDFGVLWE